MNLLRKPGIWGSAIAFMAVAALLLVAGCGDDDDDKGAPTNHAPTITGVSVNPSTVTEGGSATVTVVASDEDNDQLTYSYSPNGGAISGIGSSVTWSGWAAAGSYTVTVTVSDGEKEAQGTGAVTVSEAATGITGTAVATAGVQADLRNSLVRLFPGISEFNADTPTMTVAAQGTEFSVSFSFTGLAPGTYYLDLWKDMDNSGSYTTGDLYGVHGIYAWPSPTPSAIMVTQGQMVNIGEIMLYAL
ncbi:MAG: hypothetical protein KAY24_07245 [Candidatus Eisenbacteria sp.]|nr:hypothetical protein [Candidatus Eisenbacteria bacterium]